MVPEHAVPTLLHTNICCIASMPWETFRTKLVLGTQDKVVAVGSVGRTIVSVVGKDADDAVKVVGTCVPPVCGTSWIGGGLVCR